MVIRALDPPKPLCSSVFPNSHQIIIDLPHLIEEKLLCIPPVLPEHLLRKLSFLCGLFLPSPTPSLASKFPAASVPPPIMAPANGSAPNVESKSAAKKKRGKAEARPTSSNGTATPAADATIQALPADLPANGVDSAGDSPYMKELSK